MVLIYKSYNYINKQFFFLIKLRGEGVEGVEGVFEIPLFHFFTIYYYYNEIVPITMITFTIHITINP